MVEIFKLAATVFSLYEVSVDLRFKPLSPCLRLLPAVEAVTDQTASLYRGCLDGVGGPHQRMAVHEHVVDSSIRVEGQVQTCIASFVR